MKKLVLAIGATLFATAVYATCTTNTIFDNGKMKICTTCCYGSQCTTTCI